jgi:hypothetical protein
MIPCYRAIQQIESEAVKEVNKFTMTPFFVKGRRGTLCQINHSLKSFIKIIRLNQEHIFWILPNNCKSRIPISLYDFPILMVKERDNIHKRIDSTIPPPDILPKFFRFFSKLPPQIPKQSEIFRLTKSASPL